MRQAPLAKLPFWGAEARLPCPRKCSITLAAYKAHPGTDRRRSLVVQSCSPSFGQAPSRSVRHKVTLCAKQPLSLFHAAAAAQECSASTRSASSCRTELKRYLRQHHRPRGVQDSACLALGARRQTVPAASGGCRASVRAQQGAGLRALRATACTPSTPAAPLPDLDWQYMCARKQAVQQVPHVHHRQRLQLHSLAGNPQQYPGRRRRL